VTNRRLAPVLAFVAFGLTSTAHADEEELNQASKKVFQEARAAADKGDWALCRTRAIGVWQQVKSPNVAGILGICEAELGMNVDAAGHLELFLAKQTKATPQQVAEVKKSLDKVLPKVAKVTVIPNPDDSDVFVDDVLVGRGRQTVFLAPGDARIGAAKDGQSISKTVSVKAGEVVPEYRIEVPKDPAGAGAGGTGGTGMGGAGAGGSGAAVGGAGGAGAGGADVGPPAEGAPTWPTITLGVAGGVLLAAGIGTLVGGFVVEAGVVDRATGLRCDTDPACADNEDDFSTANTLGAVGIASLALGAAAMTGMVVYLVATGDDESKTHTQLRVGPAGLVFEGSF
jgi:hypothetical protein